MIKQNKQITGLPPLLAVMLFLTSTTGNALAADDKACAQQERTNKTLSEKLDQSAGVICPPDIDPAIKAPTPNAGKTPVIPSRVANARGAWSRDLSVYGRITNICRTLISSV